MMMYNNSFNLRVKKIILGERHIVVFDPLRGKRSNYSFSSRNSLFSMDQLDEILEIIGHSD